jgi:hypothetical protein
MPVSRSPRDEFKGWFVTILIVIIGLLALFFFLSMGSVFALIGPWIILAGTLLAAKRVKW